MTDVVDQLRSLRTDIARAEAEIRSREAARDRAQEQIAKLLTDASEASGETITTFHALDQVIAALEARAEELTEKLYLGLLSVRSQIDANTT